MFNLTSNMTYVREICPNDVQISFIVHGWLEGFYTTEWVPLVINATLKEAGGCVVFMDYSHYSKHAYSVITERYFQLRNTLVNVAKLFGNYENMHCFGFSFGARLCIGFGNKLTSLNNGTPVIPRMDLCDPAGPAFHLNNYLYLPPKRAAKNVACMHTTTNYGTDVYNCHQDYKMGRCGTYQDARGPFPKVIRYKLQLKAFFFEKSTCYELQGSHGLCPYMYYYAFTNDFKYDTVFASDCDYTYSRNRPLNHTCQEKMIVGYRNR